LSEKFLADKGNCYTRDKKRTGQAAIAQKEFRSERRMIESRSAD